jgi:hypothetical protein
MKNYIFIPIVLLLAACGKDEEEIQKPQTVVQEVTVCIATPEEETAKSIFFSQTIDVSIYEIEIAVWNLESEMWAVLPEFCTDQDGNAYQLNSTVEGFYFEVLVTEYGHEWLPDTHQPCFDFRLRAIPK